MRLQAKLAAAFAVYVSAPQITISRYYSEVAYALSGFWKI